MSHQIHPVKTRFTFIKNYSYFIIDLSTGSTALVDPAWDFPQLNSVIISKDLKLTTILLTHHHLDHVNLVRPFIKQYQPTVYISQKEIARYKFRCPNLTPVQHNDQIEFGQTIITCLETPGHTAGSMCFLLPDALFTGDTIFIEGCGMCKTPGGDPWAMYQSLQMIKERVDPTVNIYPGHSYGKPPGYPLGYLLKENTYFLFNTGEAFVKYRMRPRQTRLFRFK
ncbi:MAG TPA: MBL fold metallo-hydrolase [Bacillota bacterium]|nr:MBL fold metallo-hydrolase [Bacillota bacterium]